MNGSDLRPFATLDDITTLFRPLQPSEIVKATKLLKVVSDSLRVAAAQVGKDLDCMIQASPALATVATSVTVDVVGRALMTSTDSEPMTQVTQSAGGYSASGTYLVPGGGIYIKKSELARLGLRRQKIGVIDFYGTTQGNPGCALPADQD